MPSTRAIPTIDQLRSAAIDAVRAQQLERADNHTGAVYDYFFGSGAVLWSRELQFARDLFRAIYIDDADGADLTARIQQIWGIPRIFDSYGTGFATFSRPTATAGEETFHEGTRVRVGSTFYAVAGESPTAAAATYAIVPIRATTYGPGVAVASQSASIDDSLNDRTWSCIGLTCADGTQFEKAPAYRARARTLRVNNRVGYANGPQSAIFQACSNAGAAYVAAFPSTAFGPSNDHGISAIYAGDASYSGSQALTNRIILALESARALGAEVLVGPMVPTSLAITATVYLSDQPSLFDTRQLTSILRGALLSSFYSSTTGGFTFTRDSLAASMLGVSGALQSIAFTSPSSDIAILTGTPLVFPASLPRYVVTPQAINFVYAPPQ